MPETPTMVRLVQFTDVAMESEPACRLESPPLGAATVAALRGWAAALESGAYPETKRRLRSHTGYCCLGVACDIRSLGVWIPPVRPAEKDPDAYYRFVWTAGGADGEEESALPIVIAAKLGLAWTKRGDDDGAGSTAGMRADGRDWLIGGRAYVALAQANDQGAGFPAIAAALRAYADEIEGWLEAVA